MKKLLKLTAVLTVIALLASCFAVFSVSAGDTDPGYTIGDATYTVTTAAGLQAISTGISEGTIATDITIKLGNDIVFGESDTFTPIGTSTYKFAGTFDGNNKTISGMKIDSAEKCVGLLSYSGGAGVLVQNLTIKDSSIKGNTHVGAIIGSVDAGCTDTTVITNVKVINTTISTTVTKASTACVIGSIIGGAYADINITNVFVNADISGTKQTGGLVGLCKNAISIDVRNAVSVSSVDGSTGQHIGGLVGCLNGTEAATFTNCINAGTVNINTSNQGMIVGYGYNAQATTATNCYIMGAENVTVFGGTGANNGKDYTNSAVEAKTRDELAAIIKTMGDATENKYTLATEALAGLFGNDMVYAQIRESDNALRFVAPITGKDYKAVGMTITATYNGTGKSVTKTATTLYKTITETKDGATTHTTAVENEYFYCFVLTGAPEGVTFEITTFVTVDDGSAEGITYPTGTYTATYTAGTLK